MWRRRHDVEEHLESLETILSLLQISGIAIKLSKCFFMQESIEHLGHIVKSQELSFAPKMIDTVRKRVPPETKTQVRLFFMAL